MNKQFKDECFEGICKATIDKNTQKCVHDVCRKLAHYRNAKISLKVYADSLKEALAKCPDTPDKFHLIINLDEVINKIVEPDSYTVLTFDPRICPIIKLSNKT